MENPTWKAKLKSGARLRFRGTTRTQAGGLPARFHAGSLQTFQPIPDIL